MDGIYALMLLYLYVFSMVGIYALMLLYLYVSSMVGIYASLKVPSMNRKTKLVFPTPENTDLYNGLLSLSWLSSKLHIEEDEIHEKMIIKSANQ